MNITDVVTCVLMLKLYSSCLPYNIVFCAYIGKMISFKYQYNLLYHSILESDQNTTPRTSWKFKKFKLYYACGINLPVIYFA